MNTGIFRFDLPRTSSACALVITLLFSTGTPSTWATETLVYSFEGGTDGFAPNSGGTTISQDTIGATDGSHSLKVSLISGPGFAGGLTTVLPAAIGDPPGIEYVLFDLTITQEFNPPLPEPPGFAVIGVFMFGHSQPGPGQILGLQAEFADTEHVDGLAVGTYTNLRIDLDSATHPLTFEEDQSFNDIFGTEGSGQFDLLPSGFEFTFNKTQSLPMTVYIDNVRVGFASTQVAGDYNGNGIVDAADYTVWRNTLGSTTDLTANGDDTGESAGKIDQADYVFWKSRFGAISGAGNVSAVAAPEPASAILLVLGGLAWCGARIGGATRSKTAR